MIHVITAHSRPDYLPHVAATLHNQGIQWHIIPSAKITVPREISNLDWVHVHPFYVKNEPPYSSWLYTKLNWFIDTIPLVDGDHYGALNDDDFACPGTFTKIRGAASNDPEVIFLSLHASPGIELIAKPENIRPSLCWIEQFYVRADILRQHRFLTDNPVV